MELKKVREDKAEQERLKMDAPPTFFEGKISEALHDFDLPEKVTPEKF